MAQATAKDTSNITHLVILDEDNQPVVSRCHRVRPSMFGMFEPVTLTQDRPSCAPCARLWDNERRK